MPPPALVKPRRPAPVFVCRKCLKRSDDAREIKTAIKHATKRALRPGDKPSRVVMTACFGLCPKRAVVVTGGTGAARGEYCLVSSADEVDGALALLRLAQTPPS